MKSLLPPVPMIEDADLLVNKDKQAAFATMMTERDIGSACSELSEWCHSVRNAKSKGLTLPKNGELAVVRQHGKRCCGAHAVLVAVDPKAMPKELSDLGAYVISLEARLRKKGIGEGQGLIALPEHPQAVLGRPKEAASAAKVAQAKGSKN